jgi:hypothetical protein
VLPALLENGLAKKNGLITFGKRGITKRGCLKSKSLRIKVGGPAQITSGVEFKEFNRSGHR